MGGYIPGAFKNTTFSSAKQRATSDERRLLLTNLSKGEIGKEEKSYCDKALKYFPDVRPKDH